MKYRYALVLVAPLLMAAGDEVPGFDVKATCHTSGVRDAVQSEDSCLHDELGAKDELRTAWAKIPGDVRQACTDEVKIGGLPSYVELLTCSQMHQWSKQEPSVSTAPAGGRAPATR